MFWFGLVKSAGKIYILADKDGLTAWLSEHDAINYWEVPYHRATRHSHLKSMSACIHYIQFEPRVIGFNDIESLKESELIKPQGQHYLLQLSGEAGACTALLCTGKKAKQIYAKGRIPSLTDRED